MAVSHDICTAGTAPGPCEEWLNITMTSMCSEMISRSEFNLYLTMLDKRLTEGSNYNNEIRIVGSRNSGDASKQPKITY